MSKYDNLQIYTQKDWEEREIEHQAELRILRDENERLEKREQILNALKAGGVDNWEWYGESMCELWEKWEEEEKP